MESGLPSTIVAGAPGYKQAWVRVAEGIMLRIADGRYPAGQWLPGLAQLSIDLGTSRRMAHEALSALCRVGFISHVERVGYYPGDGQPPPQEHQANAQQEVSAPSEPDVGSPKTEQDSQPPRPSLNLLNKGEWLTVGELQAALRVSKVTAYQLVRSGAVPAARVGRQYRVSTSGARAYMKAAGIPSLSQPDSEHLQGTAKCTADDPPPYKDKLLSVSEVAERFGVNRHVVEYWDRVGHLKASSRTSGGHRRWREADVVQMLNNSEEWVSDYRRNHNVSTDDIVRMRDVEGMSWTAIAAELGMTRWGIRCRYDRNKRSTDTSVTDATHKQPVSVSADPDQQANGVRPEVAWHVLLSRDGRVTGQE
jgi:excisionase family DNA binding protein